MRKLLIVLLILLIPQFSWATVRSFDGVGDEVDMGNVLDVTTGNVSICIFSNLTEDATADEMMNKKTSTAATTAGYSLRQGTTDTVSSRFADGTTQVQSTTTTDIDGAWYFICATWNGSTDTAILYVNAVQEDTDTGVSIGSLSNATNFTLGQEGDNGGGLTGLEAYGMQFASVLTVPEITHLQWKPWSLPTNGYWPMYGGDSPEQDLSGNNNDGTVTGATTNAGGPPVMIGSAPI